MKRIFVLAVFALIANLSFAQKDYQDPDGIFGNPN